MIESKMIENENNEMLDNKKIEIPLDLADLINLAIWLEVIDEKEMHDLWELVQPHNRQCLIPHRCKLWHRRFAFVSV